MKLTDCIRPDEHIICLVGDATYNNNQVVTHWEGWRLNATGVADFTHRIGFLYTIMEFWDIIYGCKLF